MGLVITPSDDLWLLSGPVPASVGCPLNVAACRGFYLIVDGLSPSLIHPEGLTVAALQTDTTRAHCSWWQQWWGGGA